MPTTTKPTTDQTAAAIRHAVFRDLLDMLPIASYDQARQFAANLSLCRSQLGGVADAGARERIINAALVRFLNLRVTPELAETPYRGATRAEIESWLAKKYGDRLAAVAGWHRVEIGDHFGPWRLNLPERCAVYGYRSAAGFYNGLLFQPLDRLDSFFLLSSAKYGGPKAVRLTPRDEQYFTQFEETVGV